MFCGQLLEIGTVLGERKLEKYALGFIKQIPDAYKALMRPFIWEATENWTYISPEMRFYVLRSSGQGNDIMEIKPYFNDHHTIAFLAAGIAHHSTIQEIAKNGCETSERYLEFMNCFIQQAAKGGLYTSRKGDRLFETPGTRFGGRRSAKLIELQV